MGEHESVPRGAAWGLSQYRVRARECVERIDQTVHLDGPQYQDALNAAMLLVRELAAEPSHHEREPGWTLPIAPPWSAEVDRAELGAQALAPYVHDDPDESRHAALLDLLADLRAYAAREGVDFEPVAASARRTHYAELARDAGALGHARAVADHVDDSEEGPTLADRERAFSEWAKAARRLTLADAERDPWLGSQCLREKAEAYVDDTAHMAGRWGHLYVTPDSCRVLECNELYALELPWCGEWRCVLDRDVVTADSEDEMLRALFDWAVGEGFVKVESGGAQ